ncbi:Uncharacterised protein [Bordetella pertussis]|nr:Uncharacterised protein [Bordetella pertussis]CPK08958.1 Uncharacterised protein [Bordetella pertussis]CPP68592.1 Uncharacterised protein [Bordetella pertussis]CPQ42757.1 Uncharacterised protein [Bordetella pertussis]
MSAAVTPTCTSRVGSSSAPATSAIACTNAAAFSATPPACPGRITSASSAYWVSQRSELNRSTGPSTRELDSPCGTWNALPNG